MSEPDPQVPAVDSVVVAASTTVKRYLRGAGRRLKPALRPVVSPVERRMAERVNARLTPRIDALEERLAATRNELDGVRRYLGPVLNAIQAQAAQSRDAVRREETAHRHLAEVTSLLFAQLQEVRNELLSELRYGAPRERPAASDDTWAVEARVLHPEKVRAAGRELRLALGEPSPGPPYLTVATQEGDGVDVVAEAGALPFEPATVAEIACTHLLELFALDEIRAQILPHWLTLLQPKGRLVVVVPDADKAIEEFAAGRISVDELRRAAFGAPDGATAFRYTVFRADALRDLLVEVGFVEVDVVSLARPAVGAYEMRLEATRPADDVPAPS
jgi:hypothetical protein